METKSRSLRRLRRLALVALVGIAWLSSPTAPAAAETPVRHHTYQALFADAIFQGESDGVHTDINVQAITGHMAGGIIDDEGQPVGPPDFELPGMFVLIEKYQLPDWEPLYQAYALVELTESDVYIDPQLRSAWLRTTVDATDSNGASIPVSIDVTWTAEGPFVVEQGRLILPPPDRWIYHVVARYREGTFSAEGQVVVDGENLTPAPTDIGFIQRINGFAHVATG